MAGGKEACWDRGEVCGKPVDICGLAGGCGGGGDVVGPVVGPAFWLGNMFFVTLLLTGDI